MFLFVFFFFFPLSGHTGPPSFLREPLPSLYRVSLSTEESAESRLRIVCDFYIPDLPCYLKADVSLPPFLLGTTRSSGLALKWEILLLILDL